MATQSFQVIYNVFLSKISDYSFLNLTQADLEVQLERYLVSAIPKFRFCKNLDRDMATKTFNNTLLDMEVEILASLMIVEYIKPKIVTSELLKQSLSDKDFRLYSQANQLHELMALYKEMKSEVTTMITEYSYLNGDLGMLK